MKQRWMIRCDVDGASGIVCYEQGEPGSRCLPLTVSTARIREAAQAVVTERPEAQPLVLASPVGLEVDLNDGPYLDAVRKLYGDQMNGDRTLVLTGKNATAVWADYWRKKLAAQGEAMGE